MGLQLVMEAIFHTLDDPEYNIYLFSVDKEEEVSHGAEDAVHWLLEIHPRFPAELGGLELASGIRVISGLPEDFAQTLKRKVDEVLADRSAGTKRPRTPMFYAKGPELPPEMPKVDRMPSKTKMERLSSKCSMGRLLSKDMETHLNQVTATLSLGSRRGSCHI